jgi:hypothetical protein
MRNLNLLNAYRCIGPDIIKYFGSTGDHTCGFFVVPSPIDKGEMKVMASSDYDWDHVSVSRPNRCPNWTEMEHVRHLFFKDDETVMQLHVPVVDHISVHPNCLHMWRPQKQEIPRPPSILVA